MEYSSEDRLGEHHQDDDRRVDAAYRVLLVIWGALVAGVVIFAVVSYALLRSGAFQPVGGPGSPLAFTLITVGFGLLIVAPFLGQAVGRRSTGAGGTPANVAAYQTSMIVGHALREAAGLLGVVTALVAGALLGGYVLAAAAVLMMIKGRPRREHLVELSRSL